MGWRNFQVTAPMEFMENMELITPNSSLIPLIPLIPVAGESEKTEFNSLRWQAAIAKLADELSSKDPGGDCWEYVKEYHPEAWRDFVAAEQQIDIAYSEQNAEQIGAAISRTRATYINMIELCNGRGVTKKI